MKSVGLTDPDHVVKESVALLLFQRKLVSIGKAAKLADMSVARFMDLLESLRIPQVEYTQEDFQSDLATIKRLRQGKRRNWSLYPMQALLSPLPDLSFSIISPPCIENYSFLKLYSKK